MAGEAFADDRAGGGVESREQAEGSVTGVVMRAPLDLAWAHGQQRLRSIERLNLALFVDAQDNGAFGRRKVKADDVAHFFDEQGIGRQLEGLGAMRLKAEGFPDSVDRRGRQSDGFGQRAQAPMRRVPRRRLQRQTNDLRDLVVADLARRARTGLVVETAEAMLREPPPPFAHRVGGRAHAHADVLVLRAFRRQKDDARPLRQSLRGLST